MAIEIFSEPKFHILDNNILVTWSRLNLNLTIRDWNDLPESLISSYELSDDCVSKFTSLVRARD